MLMIIMHNKRDYLESLLDIMKKENIDNATIIEKKGLGVALLGEKENPFFHRGSFSSEYDNALLAIIRDNETARHLAEVIDNDPTLKKLNFEEKGYLCTVPFKQIKSLELKSSEEKRKGQIKRRIGEYFTPERIALDLKAQDKEEAINEVSALLKNAEEINDYDIFLQEIFEREKLSSTCIGNEIAVPHARTDAVNDFLIAFGRSKKGIDFNSSDGQLVKLIFVLGTPKKKGLKSYLRILAHLNRILQKKYFKDFLLTASNCKDIIDEFNRIGGDVL